MGDDKGSKDKSGKSGTDSTGFREVFSETKPTKKTKEKVRKKK
jgi:hypothetical protein